MATPEDLAYWDDAAAGGAERLLSDTVVCTADGRTVHVERSIVPLAAMPAGGAAAPTHCVVSLLDRSAQQQAEDATRGTAGRTAGHAGVHRRRHPGHRPERPHARLQPPLRADLAVPDDLLEQRNDTAVHDWMRRSVVEPEAYERRLQAVQHATLLSTTERLALHSGRCSNA